MLTCYVGSVYNVLMIWLLSFLFLSNMLQLLDYWSLSHHSFSFQCCLTGLNVNVTLGMCSHLLHCLLIVNERLCNPCTSCSLKRLSSFLALFAKCTLRGFIIFKPWNWSSHFLLYFLTLVTERDLECCFDWLDVLQCFFGRLGSKTSSSDSLLLALLETALKLLLT